MASTLLGFSSLDEDGHTLKDLISPPEILENKVLAMQFQEPVI